MANLIFPLSMQPPLPKDDGVISASIASGYAASAEASKSQAALEAVQAALEKAAAEQYKNEALAVSQQVTQSKVDIDAIRADLIPIHLGRLNGDSAANNTASANGLGSTDGLRYFNVTTNKLRVRSGGVWSDEVLPGVSAAAAATSAASAETSRQAAEVAATSATTLIAGAKIASLTTSALRSLAVVAGKSVELLGYARANDYGSGSFVGAVAASFNGAISGSGSIRTLTVSGLSAGFIYSGMLLSFGTNITVLKQVSGDTGGNGTYAVASSQNTTSTTAMTAKFVDDGGRYFVPDGGDGTSAWVRQIDYSQAVSAGWWGVKANFTDYDHVAARTALNAMSPVGGHLVFPPGKMRFAEQVTITRTSVGGLQSYPASGGVQYEFVGHRTLKISGFGCEIHTVGNIAGLKIGPQSSYGMCILEGFTFHHQNNTDAKCGLWVQGTANLKVLFNTFYMSATLPANYAGIILDEETISNDFGAILSDFEMNNFCTFGSQDGAAPYCMAIYGAHNAIRIVRNNFGGAKRQILITHYPNDTYIANAVIIDGNSFEGGGATSITSITGGTISGDVLTVTSIASNRYVLPEQQLSGTSVIPETTILSQLTSTAAGGALGKEGTYRVSKDHTSVGTLTALCQITIAAPNGIATAPAVGDVYSVSGVSYTVTGVTLTGTPLVGTIQLSGPSSPPIGGGTLTRETGAGAASITYASGAVTWSPFTSDNTETAITIKCEHNIGATRYIGSGIIIKNNRGEKLDTFLDLQGTANAVQIPITLEDNWPLTSVKNWVKNPNNLPINNRDTALLGAAVGPRGSWNNQGFEWAANTPAPVTLTNASISGDILTVGAGSGINPNMAVSGTGVNSGTRVLWQISGVQYGAGVYKLSSSHATPVTASTSSPIALEHPDPFTYRFRALNRGFVGRLISDSSTLNNTILYRHDYAQFVPIGTNLSSGELGTILGGASSTRRMKLRAIDGIASGYETPYNFIGSVTFAAERERLVRFPSANLSSPTRFFGSISGNLLTASASNLQGSASGLAISGDGFTATIIFWQFDRQATTGGVTNGTGDDALTVSAITEVSPGVYNLTVSGVTLTPATSAPGPAAVYRLYGQDYTVVSATLTGNAPARSGTIQVTGPSLPHAGTPVTTAIGTSLPTFRYSLSGTNADRPFQEMYSNQLSETNGNYIVVLEYGGSGELSKPLRVKNKSNVGFTIDAGNGAFNYVIAIATPNGITNAPAVGDVYRIGGVNYTVTGISLTGTAPNRVGTIQLSGPSDPTATGGTLARLNGAGDASITYVNGAVSAGFTFNVSRITTAPVFSNVAANNAIYNDANGVSYALRSSSLTTTPVGYIYGTLHMSAPLGTVPPASGNLTKTGTAAGDSTIAFSAVTSFENRITGPVRWMLVKTVS